MLIQHFESQLFIRTPRNLAKLMRDKLCVCVSFFLSGV